MEGRTNDLELALPTELPQELLFKTLEDQINYLHSVKTADSNMPKEM